MADMVNGLVSTSAIRSIWLLLRRFRDKSSSCVFDPVNVLVSAGLSPDVFMPVFTRLQSLGYIRYGLRRGLGDRTVLGIFLLKDDLGQDILQAWEPTLVRPNLGRGNGVRNTDLIPGSFPKKGGLGSPNDIADPSLFTGTPKASTEVKSRKRSRGRKPKQLNAVLKILIENARLTESGKRMVGNPVALLVKRGIPERSVFVMLSKLEQRSVISKIPDPRDKRRIGAVVFSESAPNT